MVVAGLVERVTVGRLECVGRHMSNRQCVCVVAALGVRRRRGVRHTRVQSVHELPCMREL